MNFLYLYPCYSAAREAYSKKLWDDNPQVHMADVNNLTLKIGSDTHVFRYVPIRVHVDIERLGMIVSVLHLQPLIEELCSQVKKELIKLNDYVVSATRVEVEADERARTRSNPSPKLQTPDAPSPGGSSDSSSTELGSKTISGDAVLQGRFDF